MLKHTGTVGSQASKGPATSGASIPVKRPNALAAAHAVPRTSVGNSAGVKPYRIAYAVVAQNDTSMPAHTTVKEA